MQMNVMPEAALEQPTNLRETRGTDSITAGQELGKQRRGANCVLTGSDTLPGATV